MEDFILGNLKIQCQDQDGVLLFHWLGSSDNRELIQALEVYYTDFVEKAKEKKAVLDFRQLKHFQNLATLLGNIP